MPNSFFQFKQFTVHQQKTAMKVCTDSCLFGAWVANVFSSKINQPKTILDIGAGTGLLSLMLAQKLASKIDAVETEEQAAIQAEENFKLSPWKDRLKVIKGDIRKLELQDKYDLIISNPPFFENSLQGLNIQRNMALHSSQLTFDELLLAAKNLLNHNGYFAVLLPFSRTDLFLSSAAGQQFFLQKLTLVKQTEKHDYFRSMLLFGCVENKNTKTEIIIKKDQKYSDEFVCLLKDYYLHL